MAAILGFVVGVMIGGAVVWIWVVSREQQARVRAETQREEALRRLEDQKRLLEEARHQLGETFQALSAEVLRNSNQQFLTLAEQKLTAMWHQARGDLDKREEAIQGVVRPLQEALRRYEEQVRDMEKQSHGLERELGRLNAELPALKEKTEDLVNAFKHSQVRGQLGEVVLERILEEAGLMEQLAAFPQVSLQGDEDKTFRPDWVLKLPGGRSLIIDAKAPMKAYWEALEATDAQSRDEALRRHAEHFRKHIQALAAKGYWRMVPGAMEFVVMFVPIDPVLTMALQTDPELWRKANELKIILVTPLTILALVKVVQMFQQQERMAHHAREVSEEAKKLCDRLFTFNEHLLGVHKGLEVARKSYDRAAGSFNRMVIPAATRMKHLGVPMTKDIQPLPAREEWVELPEGGSADVPPQTKD